MFTRLDDPKKEPYLNIERREEIRFKRYEEIEKASSVIQKLLEENEELLKADDVDFKYWNLYLRSRIFCIRMNAKIKLSIFCRIKLKPNMDVYYKLAHITKSINQ